MVEFTIIKHVALRAYRKFGWRSALGGTTFWGHQSFGG